MLAVFCGLVILYLTLNNPNKQADEDVIVILPSPPVGEEKNPSIDQKPPTEKPIEIDITKPLEPLVNNQPPTEDGEGEPELDSGLQRRLVVPETLEGGFKDSFINLYFESMVNGSSCNTFDDIMFDSEQIGTLLKITIKGFYHTLPKNKGSFPCTRDMAYEKTEANIPVDLNITKEISISLGGQKNKYRISQNNLQEINAPNVFIR